MPFFARIFELVASLGGFLFGLAQYQRLRFLLSLLALGLSLFFIGYWLRLEKKFGYGRWWWGLLFNIWAESKFLAKKVPALARQWKKLQGVFESDKLGAVLQAEQFFNEVLDFYFEKEEPLAVRLEKISTKVIVNLDRLRLATEAVGLIKQKFKSGAEVKLTEAEVKAILQEFEQALLSMLVIKEEDRWVS